MGADPAGHADSRRADRRIAFEGLPDLRRQGRLPGQCRVAELDVDGDLVAGDPDSTQGAGGNEVLAAVRIDDAGEDFADACFNGFAHGFDQDSGTH